MTQTSAAVRLEVVVDAGRERAFEVFTADFGGFKPPEHNMLEVPIAETVFEPRVGGHIVDRGTDGSECRWARILAYEPPDRVVFSWDISPRWEVISDLDEASEVEVTFTDESPGRTRSSSSTGISTGTAPAGTAYAMASRVSAAGRSTWPATATWWPADLGPARSVFRPPSHRRDSDEGPRQGSTRGGRRQVARARDRRTGGRAEHPGDPHRRPGPLPAARQRRPRPVHVPGRHDRGGGDDGVRAGPGYPPATSRNGSARGRPSPSGCW